MGDNPELILWGIYVIIILLIVVYVAYPIYFEIYVLMKIPEYRNLKITIDASEKAIAEMKNTTDELRELYNKNMKARVALSGDAVVRNGDMLGVLSLTNRIKMHKKLIHDYTNLIAKYKQDLKIATDNHKNCTKLQQAATLKLRELNDAIIMVIPLDDKKLVSRVRTLEDSIIKSVENSLMKTCKDTTSINMEIKNTMKQLRSDINTTGYKHCDFTSNTQANGHAKSMLELRNSAKMIGISDDIASSLESVLSYIIYNKFCDSKNVLDVDAIETFLLNLVAGMCKNTDWKDRLRISLSYGMRKHASYLPKNKERTVPMPIKFRDEIDTILKSNNIA